MFCYLSDGCCNCSRLLCVRACVHLLYISERRVMSASGERVTGLPVRHIDYHIARERGIIKRRGMVKVWS